MAALDRWPAALIGLALGFAGVVVYVLSNPGRVDFYNHFVWQADAWLHGFFTIPFPVDTGPRQNFYFQDVMPVEGVPGRGLLPFPPLPALVLLPVVAFLHLDTPAQAIASVLGGLNVFLAWRVAIRVAPDRAVALVATTFFAFGTAAWYASAIGTTWFLAHVVALMFTLAAVRLALDAPGVPEVPAGAPDEPLLGDGPQAAVAPRGILGRLLDARLLLAAFLLGVAAVARLTVVFGAPFLLLVGGGSWPRRVASVAIGLALPLSVLFAYNLAATGHPFNPAYGYIANNELHPIPEFWHPDWAIEDPRYIPQNSLIPLLAPPDVDLSCGLDFIDCGTVRPDPVGMSIILTSPAYLLVLPELRRCRRSRLVAGSAAAVLAIAVANLAHFSQGWVQFGYRFANDFAPFALVLVALAIARRGIDRLTIGLVGISILVNAWGVWWGVTHGW